MCFEPINVELLKTNAVLKYSKLITNEIIEQIKSTTKKEILPHYNVAIYNDKNEIANVRLLTAEPCKNYEWADSTCTGFKEGCPCPDRRTLIYGVVVNEEYITTERHKIKEIYNILDIDYPNVKII